MTVKCLTPEQKDFVVAMITRKKANQTELASALGRSRRTIQRVLLDRGIITYNERGPMPHPRQPAQPSPTVQQPLHLVPGSPQQEQETQAIAALVRSRGLTLETLERALAAPSLTKGNVQVYLTRMPHQELANLLYTVGLVKIGQIKTAPGTVMEPNKEAANG